MIWINAALLYFALLVEVLIWWCTRRRGATHIFGDAQDAFDE